MSAPVRNAGLAKAIRYEDDLYGWSAQQIAHLSHGRVAELDLVNLAEEIADVGSEQYDKLESALRVLLLHILKWDHQPALRSRSWVNTINEQRRRVDRVLGKNPSLKAAFDDALVDAYEDARGEASSETDMSLARFPERCPYTRDDFMGRQIEWLADR